MSDVCLVLEGTYPFVAGGVSTWIHQLIEAMPELRFSIVYVSTAPNARRQFKYQLPGNVVDIQDLYLQVCDLDVPFSPRERRRAAVPALIKLHEDFLAGRWDALRDALPLFRNPDTALNMADLFKSEEAWEVAMHFYERSAGDVSFLDFFWSWRSIYIPLVNTLRCPLPQARLYHTVSTGYAGLLASVARVTQDTNVLLTEHGVYTHERLLEISQATWIYTPHRERFRVQRELSFFKQLWLGYFDAMGRITYRHADRIVTLFEGNKLKQVAAGAPPEKIAIIPNGIDVRAYRELALKRRRERAKDVAFIGRVVPIKDVKTFLRAAKIVLSTMPDVDFHVIGPGDEEPEYYAECRELTKSLGLEERVRFTGKADMSEWYPRLDLVVLTSLSEAQPYVLLEANAAGVPVVATDVGACREMIEGSGPEDRVLGAGGIVTGVAHPEETAAAIVSLLADPDRWRKAAEAGGARARRYYDQDDLISRYLNLYERMMR